MRAPPESVGTRNRMAPFSTFRLRPFSSKEKMLFAPIRVMVRSAKVSSARESIPVCTAVSSRTLSSTTAGLGAALDNRSSTSRIICVTRASFFGASAAATCPAINKTAAATQLDRILRTGLISAKATPPVFQTTDSSRECRLRIQESAERFGLSVADICTFCRKGQDRSSHKR